MSQDTFILFVNTDIHYCIPDWTSKNEPVSADSFHLPEIVEQTKKSTRYDEVKIVVSGLII